MASPLLNVSQLVPLRSAHFSFLHSHFVKQVIVWKVDCSSPSSISLVQLSLPAGKSVVDTGFYTSEFLSLLVQGDGEEGQTLIHLPLVSLAPIMLPSTTTNIPIHQVRWLQWFGKIIHVLNIFCQGGRGDRRKKPAVGRTFSQKPRNIWPKKGIHPTYISNL